MRKPSYLCCHLDVSHNYNLSFRGQACGTNANIIMLLPTINWSSWLLTHWKKWYPSLFSSLKMTPFFVAKHWLFSSKWPLFHDKHWLFSPNEPPFHGKTLDIKINPFFSIFMVWVPKYILFLGKCESWIS